MNIKEFIELNLQNMKEDLGKLVSYNSVLSDDAMPFGLQNQKVLDEALKILEAKGLKTTNLDYYCGYGEVGEGEKLIGILAHLDVVPAGNGWDSDPFVMTEKDGKLYGRGTSDDKGAAVASLYALKYLMEEGYPFKKRVRLILGCNEETGSKCIAHYVEKEGHIDCGFTPDGSFPGVYAEKGTVGGALLAHNTKIQDLTTGLASNVVAKDAVFTLPENSYDPCKLKAYLDEKKIAYDETATTLTVHGKAAHASLPDLGVNAFAYGMEALYYADFNDSFVNWFHEHFALTNHGELLGYEALKDDITDTSINVGGVTGKTREGIYVSVDERFPVKTTQEKAKALLEAINTEENEFVFRGGHQPLYFDLDSPMISALMKAYVDVTGDKQSKMEAIGGGTYAKAINNCIAFGGEFAGEDCHMHDANEYISIDTLKRQIEIYVEAIKNLNEID